MFIAKLIETFTNNLRKYDYLFQKYIFKDMVIINSLDNVNNDREMHFYSYRICTQYFRTGSPTNVTALFIFNEYRIFL